MIQAPRPDEAIHSVHQEACFRSGMRNPGNTGWQGRPSRALLPANMKNLQDCMTSQSYRLQMAARSVPPKCPEDNTQTKNE